AQLPAEFAHRLRRALAAVAEMEIITGDDMGDAEPLAQFPAHEILWAHRRQRCIESDDGGESGAKRCNKARLQRQRCQPEGGLGRPEKCARMRLEGHEPPMGIAALRFSHSPEVWCRGWWR